MDFVEFRDAVNHQFSKMAKGKLFRTGIDKDILWETYLNSFPDGSNPVFRERTLHDCQCCKQFIRACGDVVSINKDLTLTSIWDIKIKGKYYQEVADNMSRLVKDEKISDQFLHWEQNIGTKSNFDAKIEDMRWDHFYFKLPRKFINTDPGTVLSKTRANKDVFLRGLDEITNESIETVLELISQDSIYRGDEHKQAVMDFQKLCFIADNFGLPYLNTFAWKFCNESGARIRNTAIGTLLIDISIGMNLDKAVGMFESKVAPENYKRPTAVITQRMIKKAQEKIEQLGFIDSLPRRNAKMDDLTINNVLFADRKAKQAMNVFDEMSNESSTNIKNLKKVEEVSIDTFVNEILPKAESIEAMFENKHENNLMSLVAPSNFDAPGMFKWRNNFSWSYNGEVADSIKERVKRAGGNIDAVLRCSLAWFNGDDLDIHVKEPGAGSHIYFGNKRQVHPSSGMLDVDMNAGDAQSTSPVENIAWTNKNKMPEGEYRVFINQFTKRNTENYGFTLEMEYEGKIWTYNYQKPMRTSANIDVVIFNFDRKTGITIVRSLESEESPRVTWELGTQKFHKVNMIMNSPNHWDGEETGNKHYFFILENCDSGEPVRGFFNEFLKESMTEHRKVFEVLGSKMKTDQKEDQLSGLGFSSTKRASLICRVKGSFERTIKINF